MKRFGRIVGRVLLWLLGIGLGVPVLAVAALLVALNTDPGRRTAASLATRLTGGAVELSGLSGRFPDRLRLAHLALHDKEGTWLAADDLLLDWSPTALLHRQALVHRLDAARLSIPRLPVSEPATVQPGPSRPFALPVRVTAEEIRITSATIGRPLLGTEAVLALSGKADVLSLQSGTAALALQPIGPDAAARYTLDGALTADTVAATLHVEEPDHGLLARIANLPDLGPVRIDGTATGPRTALRITLALDAGPLTARVNGTLDLPGEAMVLDATARAPSMTPAPGVSWRGLDLDAHVAGPFTRPDATGHLRIDAPAVAGASLAAVTATLAGNAGQASIDASFDGLRIPGPSPALLAQAPIQLHAEARLDDPARPVRFTVSHPLLTAEGTATTGGGRAEAGPAATVTLRLPDLGPVGAIAGLDLAGRTELTLHTAQLAAATTVDATGTLALLRGPAPSPALIGPAARLALSARLAGQDITLSKLTLDGAGLTLSAAGSSGPAGLDATVKAGLADLHLALPTLTGHATLDAHVTGPPNDLAVAATLAGDVGAPGFGPGAAPAPLRVTAALRGLPSLPTGRITAAGSLAGAPVALAVQADRGPDGTVRADIQQADWRSFHAEGALTLPPGATLPLGHVALRMARLDDLRALLNQPLAGALTASATLDPAAVTLEAEARGAAFAANRIGEATLKARVADPLGRPVVAATLAANGIDAAGTTGAARMEATGPLDALALRTTANLVSAGTAAQLAAAATLDVPAHLLRLQTAQATVQNPSLPLETIRLLAPATVTYAPTVSLDRLRLGVRTATLEVAGRLSPTLDATVALRSPADIAAALSPAYAADGSVTLDARLTGTPAQPGGTLRLAANGIRLRTGPGRAVPPAMLAATAQLAGGAARLDARLSAGSAALAVNGTAPLGAGPLNLRATGALDLALLDPILTAAGRRARGRVALDATVGGTVASPRLAGTAQLTGGEVQDFAQGFRITDLAATARLDGDTVRLASLSGRAGPGTISASGTVGVLAPGLPVDLVLALRNARPLASDQVSADVDADLTLRGAVRSGLAAGGSVTVRRAELRVPRTLPASVVTLDVRRPGDKPPAPAAAAVPVALDLTVRAPNAVYLRGRGIDAEMQGTLRIRGTSAAPQVGGGLEMRRGSISVAGTTLTFTRGKVGFDGTGVTGKIDPTLDFVAESTAGSVTASLAITGYVSKPVIKLSSTPDLPQDEVLAYLIFKRSAKELGPFQIAEIAAAVAELTGVGGAGGLNPLESVRKGLGLDRLSLGAGGNGVAGQAAGSASSSSTTPHGGGRALRRRRGVRRRQAGHHRQPDAGDGADRHHQGPEGGNGRGQRHGRQPGRPDLPVRVLTHEVPDAPDLRPPPAGGRAAGQPGEGRRPHHAAGDLRRALHRRRGNDAAERRRRHPGRGGRRHRLLAGPGAGQVGRRPPRHLRLQRRSRRLLRLARPRRDRPVARARRPAGLPQPGPGPRRERPDLVALHRPGVHRSARHRLQPRRPGHGGGPPPLPDGGRRHPAARGHHPPLARSAWPARQPGVPGGRELRRLPRPAPGPRPAGKPGHRRARHGADLPRAGLQRAGRALRPRPLGRAPAVAGRPGPRRHRARAAGGRRGLCGRRLHRRPAPRPPATPPRWDRLSAQVAALTGLDPALIRRRAGRPDLDAVLRTGTPGRVASPYERDGRGAGPLPGRAERQLARPGAGRAARAPSPAAMLAVYDRLDWHPDGAPRRYELLNDALARQWDYGRGNVRPESMTALRQFLALDPASRVLVAHGLTDLVTPYFATALLLRQVAEPAPPGRLSLRTFPGGHMLYLREAGRDGLRQAAAALFASSAPAP